MGAETRRPARKVDARTDQITIADAKSPRRIAGNCRPFALRARHHHQAALQDPGRAQPAPGRRAAPADAADKRQTDREPVEGVEPGAASHDPRSIADRASAKRLESVAAARAKDVLGSALSRPPRRGPPAHLRGMHRRRSRLPSRTQSHVGVLARPRRRRSIWRRARRGRAAHRPATPKDGRAAQ